MTYRVSYEDGWVAARASQDREATQTECFGTEYEALGRARELVESGVHHAVSLNDGSGDVLTGVRLQLKLGGFAAD